jgi:FMN phosphatase YigB (HAD superfamily)
MIRLSVPRPDQIQVITFDCYGTLIDWEMGIWNAFHDTAAADGVALEREQVLDRYHAIEAMVEKGRYRPYRDILAETARRVAAECGWTI